MTNDNVNMSIQSNNSTRLTNQKTQQITQVMDWKCSRQRQQRRQQQSMDANASTQIAKQWKQIE